MLAGASTGVVPYARVMVTKRTTNSLNRTRKATAAQLSVVGAQPDKPTGEERRAAALAKARATRQANRAAAKADRPEGWRSNLERYRDGDYPVSDWTDREVQKGRPEGRDGFGGPFPHFSGRQHAEIKRELLKRGQRKIDALYGTAIQTLAEVAQFGENDGARVKAAQELLNRTAGKTPEKIEIKSSDPWQDILDEVLSDEVLERVATEGDSK